MYAPSPSYNPAKVNRLSSTINMGFDPSKRENQTADQLKVVSIMRGRSYPNSSALGMSNAEKPFDFVPDVVVEKLRARVYQYRQVLEPRYFHFRGTVSSQFHKNPRRPVPPAVLLGYG